MAIGLFDDNYRYRRRQLSC